MTTNTCDAVIEINKGPSFSFALDDLIMEIVLSTNGAINLEATQDIGSNKSA